MSTHREYHYEKWFERKIIEELEWEEQVEREVAEDAAAEPQPQPSGAD